MSRLCMLDTRATARTNTYTSERMYNGLFYLLGFFIAIIVARDISESLISTMIMIMSYKIRACMKVTMTKSMH
ncbi:hypothetical protein DERP_007697 [Dermatophagoides pteronyssinus]|uniref:Uncharacterized protein n=1 Tax=Dermatophagoides pteronyssinus TaxID=6956 RepID=A0ABQ8JKG9_DERPT|nr:hypothetical protein DERP_007697 [Dermatophagoides pteronyssinus]